MEKAVSNLISSIYFRSGCKNRYSLYMLKLMKDKVNEDEINSKSFK